MSIHARVRMPGSTMIGTTTLMIGKTKALCTSCGREVFFSPSAYDEIVALACRDECRSNDKFWDKSNLQVICSPDPSVIQHPKTKPAIVTHQEKPMPKPVELEKKTEKPVQPVPMQPLQPVQSPPVVDSPSKPELCPSCGGGLKGRGYAHQDGCPLSTAAKLAAMKANSPVKEDTCPECHGIKKGRGYAHVEGCSLSTAAKLAAKKST